MGTRLPLPPAKAFFCSISPSDSCSPLFSHSPPLLPHKYFLRTSLHTLLPFSFIDSLVPSPLRRGPWTESTWTFPLFQTLTRAHNGIICQAGTCLTVGCIGQINMLGPKSRLLVPSEATVVDQLERTVDAMRGKGCYSRVCWKKGECGD